MERNDYWKKPLGCLLWLIVIAVAISIISTIGYYVLLYLGIDYVLSF